MTTYDVSPNLINRLQILLRKEAGLPPSDQSPPSIPPHPISAVGSNSDDALRCDSCTRDLLRGVDSVICVFCGKLRNCPFPKQPIGFPSTFGFHWFLRSFSLDGSETVERPIEGGSELGSGQNSVKNEIPLSALLDLQLKWPDESNRFGVENEPGKQSVKLVGLDFDELFQRDASGESVPSHLNEQEVTSRETKIEEGTTFAGHSSLSLFGNTQTGTSENDEADWAAEFQSANADVKVDPRFQMNSAHQPHKQEDTANVEIFQAFPTSVVESKSEPPFDPKHFQRTLSVKDEQKGLETIDDSFDWLPAADKQKLSDKRYPLQDDKLGGENSVDNWDEVGIFSGAENNRGEHISSTVPESETGGGFDMYDSWNDFTGSVGHNQLQNGVGDEFALAGHAGMGQQDAPVESTVSTTANQDVSFGLSGPANDVDDSFDLWNNFKSSDIKDNNQQQFTIKEASGDKVSSSGLGTFNAQNDGAGLSGGVKEQNVGSSEAVGYSSAVWNDNSSDVWSDFAVSSSTGVLDSKPTTNDAPTGLDDFSSIMVTDLNFPQSGETTSVENQTSVKDDDDFGSWSDFRSSWKQPESSFPDLNLNGSMQNNISAERDSENLASVKDNNLQNSWGDVGWSTSILEQPSHVVEAKPSESKLTSENSDLFLGFYDSEKQSSIPDNQVKSNGTAVQNAKSTIINDEEIDVWTDFTSSTNEQAKNWLGSNVQTPVIKEPVIHDPFSEWNTISRATSKESYRITAVLDANQMNIFSANVDSHFAGSNANSPIHQDPFFGMLNDQNGFAQATSSQAEVPNLVRTEDKDVEPGVFDNGSESAFKGGNDQKAVVESLISEMHDLSFMLDSTLSIPKTDT
ncbi:hypothetical protein vseg_019700 [Gypsophila vaccaria]